jgi:hypothetical protein
MLGFVVLVSVPSSVHLRAVLDPVLLPGRLPLAEHPWAVSTVDSTHRWSAGSHLPHWRITAAAKLAVTSYSAHQL